MKYLTNYFKSMTIWLGEYGNILGYIKYTNIDFISLVLFKAPEKYTDSFHLYLTFYYHRMVLP